MWLGQGRHPAQGLSFSSVALAAVLKEAEPASRLRAQGGKRNEKCQGAPPSVLVKCSSGSPETLTLLGNRIQKESGRWLSSCSSSCGVGSGDSLGTGVLCAEFGREDPILWSWAGVESDRGAHALPWQDVSQD